MAEIFEDVYFSRAGGPAESEYVFLRHNGLPQRFEGADTFVIAETGFGTGLNMLLTCERWAQHAPAGAHLHLISFEKFPLRPEDLRRAHAHWPQLACWCERLQHHYPPLVPGWHRLPLARTIDLWLWFGDVHEGLADLDVTVDAWYLDGFAPAKNPDMWTGALFKQMARLSAPEATFATFTSAGRVRRGLQDAGFSVEKVPGFGRKREMLRGQWTGLRRQAAVSAPRSLAVIGAGLAGAHAARRAARAGAQVTVFEAAQPARGASGNRAGVFHPLISADWNPRSRWYQLALESLRGHLAHEPPDEGGLTGLTHMAVTETWRQRFERFTQRFVEHGGVEAIVPPCEGAPPAWRYPWGGWLSPPRWVAQQLEHPGITLRQQRVDGIEQTEAGVLVAGQPFDAVVVATGAWAPPLERTPVDMIRPVAGQVDLFAPADGPLAAPWVHEGYTVPVAEGWVCGATFVRQDPFGLEASASATAENLARLQRACPALPPLKPLAARVSVRPTTRDHTPIIGLWPGSAQVAVSLGHGARGILSAPLAAEWLCADLGLIRMPQFHSLRRLSAPDRFFDH